jgi:metallophosphoesterase (TIGR00282 family)
MAAAAPGRGVTIARTAEGRPVGVINVMGRVFMPPVDDPFAAVGAAVERLRGECRVIVVDVHAEASAEKVAMGWYLAGKVTAVIGTHTHVLTADSRILPGGTAYQTDAGMTGPHDSIIGVQKDAALARFLTGMPQRMEPAEDHPRLQGVVISVDDQTGQATAIERLDWSMDDIASARASMDVSEDEV